MQKISFIKENRKWYADLPEFVAQVGTKDDCLMVAGAPELIELLAGKETNKLTIEIDIKWFEGFSAVLVRLNPWSESNPNNWGKYLATINPGSVSSLSNGKVKTDTLVVGLCPVNAWVFNGNQPEFIFIRVSDCSGTPQG